MSWKEGVKAMWATSCLHNICEGCEACSENDSVGHCTVPPVRMGRGAKSLLPGPFPNVYLNHRTSSIPGWSQWQISHWCWSHRDKRNGCCQLGRGGPGTSFCAWAWACEHGSWVGSQRAGGSKSTLCWNSHLPSFQEHWASREERG